MTTSGQGSRIPSDADKEIRMVNLGSTATTNVQPKKREMKPKPRPIISNHAAAEQLESTTRNVHAKKRGRPPKARPVPNVEPKRRKRPPKIRPVEAVARLAEATVPKPESSKGNEHLAINGETLAKKGSGEVGNFDFSEEGRRRSKALVLDNERGRSSYTENKLQEYQGTGLFNDIISGKQGPLNLRNDDPISRKSTRVDDSVVPDQGGVIVESGPSALMGNSELPIDVEEEDIEFQKLIRQLQEEETDFQMTGTDTLQPLWDIPDMSGGSSSNQPPSTLSAGHSLMTQPPSNLSSSHSVMPQPISISDYGQPSQGSQTVGMSPQPERRSLVGSSMGQENYSTTGPISNYLGPPNLGFGHQPSSVMPNHFSTQPTIAQQNQLVPPIPENQPNFFTSQPFGRETQTNFPIGGSSQNQPALGQVMGWNQPTLDTLPYLYTNGGASQMMIIPGSSYMYGSSSQSGGQAILGWNQNQSFPYSHSSVELGQNQTGSVSKAKKNSRRPYRKTRLSVMEQVGPTYGMNMDQIREFYSKLQSQQQQRMQFQPMFPLHPPMQLQPQSQSQVPSQQQSQSQFQPLLPLQLPLQPLLQMQSQPHSHSQLQQLFYLQPQYQSQSQSQLQYQLQSQTQLQPQFSLQPPMQPQYQLQPQTQLQPPIQPQLELQPQSQTHFSQPQQHQIGSAPLINEAANLEPTGGAQYQLQPSIQPQLELQPQSESHFSLPQQHHIGSAPLINEAVNLGPTGGVNPYGYEEFPM